MPGEPEAGGAVPSRNVVATSRFGTETSSTEVGPGDWRTEISPAWSIGDAANGGYAAAPVVRVLREGCGHPDPMSVATTFLRPVRGGPATIRGGTVRAGRSTTVAAGSLRQEHKDRLRVEAVFGDLAAPGGDTGTALTVPPPPLVGPDRCIDRRELAQGVALPILDRLDVRIDPADAVAGESDRAVISGWIRFSDGAPPSTLALLLFADAFPPSLFALLGTIGWVPTLELTVHVRRRPVEGWIQARFECDDLVDGRMIETGALWDESGRLVARSRQLALLLPRAKS